MADENSLQFSLGVNINGEEDIDKLAAAMQMASDSAKAIDTNIAGMSNASAMFASSLSSVVYQMAQTSSQLGKLKREYNSLGLNSSQRTSRVTQASSAYKSASVAGGLIRKGGAFDVEQRLAEIRALPESLKKDLDRIIPDVASQMRDMVIDYMANSNNKKALSSKQITDRFVRSNNFNKILQNYGLGSAERTYKQQLADAIDKMSPYMVSLFNTAEYSGQRFGTTALAGRKNMKPIDILPKSLTASWEASVKAQREMYVASKRTERVASGNKYVSQKAINDLLIPELASNPIAVRAGLKAGVLHRAGDTSLQRETNITGAMLQRYQEELFSEIINRTTGREKKINPFSAEASKQVVARMTSSSAGQALEASKVIDKLINSEFVSEAQGGAARTAIAREAKRSLEQYVVQRISMSSLPGGTNAGKIAPQKVSIQQSAGTDLLGLRGRNNADTDAIILMSVDEPDEKKREKLVEELATKGYRSNGYDYVYHALHGTGQDATMRLIRKDLYDAVRGDERVAGSRAQRARALGLTGTNVWTGFVDPSKITDARTFGRYNDANNKLFTPSADIGVNIGDRLIAVVDFEKMMGKANPADGAGWMRRSFLNRNIQGRGGTSHKGVWQTIDDDLGAYASRAGFTDSQGRWMVTGIGGETFDLLERDANGQYIYAAIQDKSQVKNLPSIMDASGRFRFTGRKANEALSFSTQDLGLREVMDVENYRTDSDRIGTQMAGYMNLSQAFRDKLMQSFIAEMSELRTPSGQFKRVFSGNTDTLSKSITEAFKNNDADMAERLLSSPEAVKRIRDYETARRRDFNAGVLYDADGTISNQLLATSFTGALMNAGEKPGKSAYARWQSILEDKFSREELNPLVQKYGGMENFIDQLFTLKYDTGDQLAVIDFKHIDKDKIGLNRAPSGRGSGVYARNLAKYALPLYQDMGESTSAANIYVPVSSHANLSSSDLDGDKVKVMVDDWAEQMRATIEEWNALTKQVGITDADAAVQPDKKAVDFASLPTEGKRHAALSTQAVNAAFGMYRGAALGQQAAMFNINDPSFAESIVRSSIYGNKVYDVATTSAKNFEEAINMPAEQWEMFKRGKEYTQYGRAFSEIFNIPLDRTEEGLAKAGLTEADIVKMSNGLEVNMKALRQANLDRINLASVFNADQVLAVSQAIKMRQSGLLSTTEADAVREAMDMLELPAWAGRDTQAYLKATRDMRHQQYTGRRGQFAQQELESLSFLRGRAVEELDRSLLTDPEYNKQGMSAWAKQRYREQQLTLIGANVAENAEDIVASKVNLAKVGNAAISERLKNEEGLPVLYVKAGEIREPGEHSQRASTRTQAKPRDPVEAASIIFERLGKQQEQQERVSQRKFKLRKEPQYAFNGNYELARQIAEENLSKDTAYKTLSKEEKDQRLLEEIKSLGSFVAAEYDNITDLSQVPKHLMTYKSNVKLPTTPGAGGGLEHIRDQVADNVAQAASQQTEGLLGQIFDRDLYNDILEKQQSANTLFSKEIFSDKKTNPMGNKLGYFDHVIKEANAQFASLPREENGIIKGLSASATIALQEANQVANEQYIAAVTHATSPESIDKLFKASNDIINPTSSDITQQIKNVEFLQSVSDQIGSSIYALKNMDLRILSDNIEDSEEHMGGLSPREYKRKQNAERIEQLVEEREHANQNIDDYVSKIQKENADTATREVDGLDAAIRGVQVEPAKIIQDTIDAYKRRIEKARKDNSDRLFNDLISEEDYNKINTSLDEIGQYIGSGAFENKLTEIDQSNQRIRAMRQESLDLSYDQYWQSGRMMQRHLYGGGRNNDLGSRIAMMQEQAIGTVSSRMQQNQRMQEQYEYSLQNALKTGDTAEIDKSRAALSRLKGEYADLENQMKSVSGAGGMFASAFTQIGSAVNNLATRLGHQMFQKAIQEVKRFVQEYDAAMTEIQMITLKSDTDMETVGQNAIDMALNLRTSVSNVTSTMSALYRQGLSDSEVAERTEDVVKFARVAGIKTTEATKIITTALNNNLVSSASEAMDVLVALGDNAATTAAEISKAMQKSAATAKQAGVDYGELTSMITLVESKTQLSGTQVGTALNTIFSRMRSMSVNQYVEDESGQVTYATDVAKALSFAGVELMDGMGGFRDATDVLLDLSKAWNTLSETQQSVITKSMAGTRMTNIFSTLMEGLSEDNGALFERYLGLAEGSEGVTDKKYEAAMESLAAALDTVRTSFDALVASSVSNGSITSVLDNVSGFLQGLANASKNTNGVSTWVTGITAAIAGLVTMCVTGFTPISGLLGMLAAGTVALGVGSAFGAANNNQENKIANQHKEIERKQLEAKSESISKQFTVVENVQKTVDDLRRIGSEFENIKKTASGTWDGLDTSKLIEQLKSLESVFPGITAAILASIGDIDKWNTKLDEVENRIAQMNIKTIERSMEVDAGKMRSYINENKENFTSEEQYAKSMSYVLKYFSQNAMPDNLFNTPLYMFANQFSTGTLSPYINNSAASVWVDDILGRYRAMEDIGEQTKFMSMSLYDYYTKYIDSDSRENLPTLLNKEMADSEKIFYSLRNNKQLGMSNETANKWLLDKANEYFTNNSSVWSSIVHRVGLDEIPSFDFMDFVEWPDEIDQAVKSLPSYDPNAIYRGESVVDKLREEVGNVIYNDIILPLYDNMDFNGIYESFMLDDVYDEYLDKILENFSFIGLTSDTLDASTLRSFVKDKTKSALTQYSINNGINYGEALFNDNVVYELLFGKNGVMTELISTYSNGNIDKEITNARYISESGVYASTIPQNTSEIWYDTENKNKAVNTLGAFLDERVAAQLQNTRNQYGVYENFVSYLNSVASFNELFNGHITSEVESLNQLIDAETPTVASNIVGLLMSENNPFKDMDYGQFLQDYTKYFKPDAKADETLLSLFLSEAGADLGNLSAMRRSGLWGGIETALGVRYGDAFKDYLDHSSQNPEAYISNLRGARAVAVLEDKYAGQNALIEELSPYVKGFYSGESKDNLEKYVNDLIGRYNALDQLSQQSDLSGKNISDLNTMRGGQAPLNYDWIKWIDEEKNRINEKYAAVLNIIQEMSDEDISDLIHIEDNSSKFYDQFKQFEINNDSGTDGFLKDMIDLVSVYNDKQDSSLLEFISANIHDSRYWSQFLDKNGDIAKLLQMPGTSKATMLTLLTSAYNKESSTSYQNKAAWIELFTGKKFTGIITSGTIGMVQSYIDSLQYNDALRDYAIESAHNIFGTDLNHVDVNSINTQLAKERLALNTTDKNVIQQAGQFIENYYSGNMLANAETISKAYNDYDELFAAIGAYEQNNANKEQLNLLESKGLHNGLSIGTIRKQAEAGLNTLEDSVREAYVARFGSYMPIYMSNIAEMFGEDVAAIIDSNVTSTSLFGDSVRDSKYIGYTFEQFLNEYGAAQRSEVKPKAFINAVGTALTASGARTVNEFTEYMKTQDDEMSQTIVKVLEAKPDYFKFFNMLTYGFTADDIVNELDIELSGKQRTYQDDAVWRKMFMGSSKELTDAYASAFNKTYSTFGLVFGNDLIQSVTTSLFSQEYVDALLNYNKLSSASEKASLLEKVNTHLLLSSAQNMFGYQKYFGTVSSWTEQMRSGDTYEVINDILTQYEAFDEYYALLSTAYDEGLDAISGTQLKYIKNKSGADYLNENNWDDYKDEILTSAQEQISLFEESVIWFFKTFNGFETDVTAELMSTWLSPSIGRLVNTSKGGIFGGLYDQNYSQQTFAGLMLKYGMEDNEMITAKRFVEIAGNMLRGQNITSVDDLVSIFDSNASKEVNDAINFLGANREYFNVLKLLNYGFSADEVMNELDIMANNRERYIADNAAWMKYFLGNKSAVSQNDIPGLIEKNAQISELLGNNDIFASIFGGTDLLAGINEATEEAIKNANISLAKMRVRQGGYYNPYTGSYEAVDELLTKAYNGEDLGFINEWNRINNALYVYRNFEQATNKSDLFGYASTVNSALASESGWMEASEEARQTVYAAIEQDMRRMYANVIGTAAGLTNISNVSEYDPLLLAEMLDQMPGRAVGFSSFLRQYTPGLLDYTDMFKNAGMQSTYAVSAKTQLASKYKLTDEDMWRILAANVENNGQLMEELLPSNEGEWEQFIGRNETAYRIASKMSADDQIKYFKALAERNTESYENYVLPLLNMLTGGQSFQGFAGVNLDNIYQSWDEALEGMQYADYMDFVGDALTSSGIISADDYKKWRRGEITGTQLDKTMARQQAGKQASLLSFGNETFGRDLSSFIDATYSDASEAIQNEYVSSIETELTNLTKVAEEMSAIKGGKTGRSYDAVQSFYKQLGYTNLEDTDLYNMKDRFDEDLAKQYDALNRAVTHGISIVAPGAGNENLAAQLIDVGWGQEAATRLASMMVYDVATGAYNLATDFIKDPDFESAVMVAWTSQPNTENMNKLISLRLTGLLSSGGIKNFEDVSKAMNVSGFNQEQMNAWANENIFSGYLLRNLGKHVGNTNITAQDVINAMLASGDNEQRYNYASPYLRMLLGSDMLSFENVSARDMGERIAQLDAQGILPYTQEALAAQGIDISPLISWYNNGRNTDEYANVIKSVSAAQDDLMFKNLFPAGSMKDKLFSDMRKAREGNEAIDIASMVKQYALAKELLTSEGRFMIREDEGFQDQLAALNKIMSMYTEGEYNYEDAQKAVNQYGEALSTVVPLFNQRYGATEGAFTSESAAMLADENIDWSNLSGLTYLSLLSDDDQRQIFSDAKREFRQTENKKDLEREFLNLLRQRKPATLEELERIGFEAYGEDTYKLGQFAAWTGEHAQTLARAGKQYGNYMYTVDDVIGLMEEEQAGVTSSANRTRLLANQIKTETGVMSLGEIMGLSDAEEIISTFGLDNLQSPDAADIVNRTVAQAEAIENVNKIYAGNQDMQESLLNIIDTIYGSSISSMLNLQNEWRSSAAQSARGKYALQQLQAGQTIGDEDMQLLMSAAGYTDQSAFLRDFNASDKRARITSAIEQSLGGISDTIINMIQLIGGETTIQAYADGGISAAIESLRGKVSDDFIAFLQSLYQDNMFGEADAGDLSGAWMSAEQQYMQALRKNQGLVFVEEAMRTAQRDENGQLMIIERMKEMNESGAYNFSENEMSQLLAEHSPLLTAAHLIGTPTQGRHTWTEAEVYAMAENERLGYGNSITGSLPYLQTFLGDNAGEWTGEDIMGAMDLFQKAMSGEEQYADLAALWNGIDDNTRSQLIGFFTDIAKEGADAAEIAERFNEQFKNSKIDQQTKYAKNGEEIASSLKNMRSGMKGAAQEAAKLASQTKKLSEGQYALDKAKSGQKLTSEEVKALADATEISSDLFADNEGNVKESFLKMLEDAISGSVTEAEQTVQDTLNAMDLKGILETNNLDINDFIQIDGSLDLAGMAAALEAAGALEASYIAALVGQFTITDTANGFIAQWINQGSAPKGGGGGGGGGGKSAAEKLIEKQKRLMDDLKHIINMINYEISEYENSGELTNLNIMLGIQNEALKDEIEQIKQNIDELVEQLAKTKIDSDDWWALQDAIQEAEEAMKEASNTISDNNRKIKENEKKILELKITLEDYVNSEIKNRKQIQKDMLAAQIDLENEVLDVIKKRYQDEWDLIKENVEKQKEALEEEKEIIDERLQARKDAEDEGDKYQKLQSLREQLATVSMDSSRTKDQAKLREQIRELEKEIAWGLAEDDVNYQKSMIDDQIQAYDEYVGLGDEYLDQLLEDNTNFAYEVNSVMKLSYDDFIAWMKRNNENFQFSLQSVQTQMIDSWKDTWYQMINYTETYWNQVDEILKSKESFLEFMKQGNDYITASITQQASMLREWQEAWEAVELSQKNGATFDHGDDYSNIGSESTATKGYGGSNDIAGILSGYTSTATDAETYFQRFANYVKKYYGYEISNYVKNQIMPEIERRVAAAGGTPGGGGGTGGTGGVNENGWVTDIYQQVETKTGKGIDEVIDIIDNYEKYKQEAQGNSKKHGGLVYRTGLEWLDGTNSKPERVLSARQTDLFDNMVNTLEDLNGSSGLKDAIHSYILATVGMSNVRVPNSFMDIGGANYNASGNMNIGSVNVVLNEAQFNTDDDYEEIARRVGDSFVKELTKQGMNVAAYSI